MMQIGLDVDRDDHRSIGDFYIFLGDNLISWGRKNQVTVVAPVQKVSTKPLLILL